MREELQLEQITWQCTITVILVDVGESPMGMDIMQGLF
jgi:hypothetical protein